jgi:hypothetical protein
MWPASFPPGRPLLTGLPVKGWDRMTDFSRYRFGEPLSDDVNANAWLPPSQAFRCEFVARQVAVKATYRLWVSARTVLR